MREPEAEGRVEVFLVVQLAGRAVGARRPGHQRVPHAEVHAGARQAAVAGVQRYADIAERKHRQLGFRFLPDTAVLARVGARTTRVRDFVSAYFNSYAEVRPSPDSLGRVEFLNSMVNKEILALSVLSLDSPLTFEERTQMRQHRQRVLSNALYQRVVLDSVIVTEDELRDLYSQFRYEQRFRHILLPDRATAERVRQLLLGGKLDWNQARRQHGVGIEKRDLMRHQYNKADLDQQMAVRAAFDPQWILNPSKVFPLEGRPASCR